MRENIRQGDEEEQSTQPRNIDNQTGRRQYLKWMATAGVTSTSLVGTGASTARADEHEENEVGTKNITNLTIDSPAEPTNFGPTPTDVEVTFTWSENHVLGPYHSVITIGPLPEPIPPEGRKIQETFIYEPGEEIRDKTLTGSETYTMTETITVPAEIELSDGSYEIPDGSYDLTVRVSEYDDEVAGHSPWGFHESQTVENVISIGHSQPDQLEELRDDKRALISEIRNSVPDEYLYSGTVVDERAEIFMDDLEDQLPDLNPEEHTQNQEALERLNESEEITLSATTEGASEIIPRSSTAITNAIMAASSVGLGKLVSSGFGFQAKKLMNDQVAARGKSVKNSLISADELDDGTRRSIANESAKAEADFARRTREAMESNEEDFTKTANKIAAQGVTSVGEGTFENLPDEFLEDIRSIASDIETTIQRGVFQYYYFNANPNEFELYVPDIDVPSEISSPTVDVPYPVNLHPDIPDEVSLKIDIPEDQINSTLQDLNETLEKVDALIELPAEQQVAGGGVDSIINKSVDELAEDVDAQVLTEQNEDTRETARSVTTDFITAITHYGRIGLDILDSIMRVSLFLQIELGLAILTIGVTVMAAVMVACIIGIGCAANVAVIGVMVKIIGILGLFDLVLATLQLVGAGTILSALNTSHFYGVMGINNTGMEGVSF